MLYRFAEVLNKYSKCIIKPLINYCLQFISRRWNNLNCFFSGFDFSSLLLLSSGQPGGQFAKPTKIAKLKIQRSPKCNIRPSVLTRGERDTCIYAYPINLVIVPSSFLLLNMHYKEWSHWVYLAYKRYGLIIKNPCKPFKAEERWFHAWLHHFVGATHQPPLPPPPQCKTHTHKNTHSIRQWRPWFCLPHARLCGMDAVSELMEQGEHRLAVNRRRWRRDQGALEAPLCIRTTAGYCHRGFLESRLIYSGERAAGSSLGVKTGCAPSRPFGLQLKGPFLLFTWDFALIHQLIAGNMLLNQTRALMIQMCQKVP